MRAGIRTLWPRLETGKGAPVDLSSATRRLALLAGDSRGVSAARAAGDLAAQPHQGIVLAADNALLQRDQGVVGDLDILRADLGAALGDVAVAKPEVILGDFAPVSSVRRMHLQFGDAHEEARPGEVVLVLGVITDHVAGVLAQVALDALAELLRAL